ncbi:Uncharacterised protein [Mycolicibacterium phlei]|nr:hypothetical protein MPHLCCUG_04278 [Mycolicibacterium phlei]KXW68437.1 hypothetical protein MPHL43072_22155 [Mycolicibacterium phlei DSM 43072]KXW69415.1 hypothetical protein MPHL43070_18875 [Mycolicibacterium phlei DSM 43070]STZ21528.1 Uncharacterised protein [Mycolicibacterium phlei]VEG11164.1 Uncharacterised protein [Mycobacteroides chelonae]
MMSRVYPRYPAARRSRSVVLRMLSGRPVMKKTSTPCSRAVVNSSSVGGIAAGLPSTTAQFDSAVSSTSITTAGRRTCGARSAIQAAAGAAARCSSLRYGIAGAGGVCGCAATTGLVHSTAAATAATTDPRDMG